MTNIWIQTQIDTIPNEFWFVDYEKGLATKSDQKPRFTSIRKWQGDIESFFVTKGIKVIKENENTLRFEKEEIF
jgi:hypothetical protein